MIANLNKVLMGLKNELNGYDVAPDIYQGKSDKWIVFSYADERAGFCADNEEQTLTASMQISIYTPVNYNYFTDKAKIKNYLKRNGASNITYLSFVDGEMDGTEFVRHQVFEADFTITE